MNKEEIRLYVAQFIKRKEGADAVAKETGINRVTLFQIMRGRNGVSPKTINRLASYYKDFDKDLILGSSEGIAKSKPLQEEKFGDVVTLRVEVAELKSQLQRKDDQIEDLIGQIDDLKALSERWQLAYLKLTQPNLFADTDPDIKIESSSHVTVKELVEQQTREWEQKQQRRQIGYHAEQVQDECKVVELYPQPKLIALTA